MSQWSVAEKHVHRVRGFRPQEKQVGGAGQDGWRLGGRGKRGRWNEMARRAPSAAAKARLLPLCASKAASGALDSGMFVFCTCDCVPLGARSVCDTPGMFVPCTWPGLPCCRQSGPLFTSLYIV